MTAPKPATPLPWEFEDLKQDWEGDASYTIKSSERLLCIAQDAQYYNSAPDKEDAAYIVHAANAYQKLIEALRFYANTEYGEQAEAMLRELGEAA